MTEVHELEDGTWEVRRDGEVLGTATLATNRRGTVVLQRLDVPAALAGEALDALRAAHREQGEDRWAVDVVPGDDALATAVADRGFQLAATQMLLDLSRPVGEPARVTLRPFTADELETYREYLVSGYAQDMVEGGMFTELTDSLAVSELSMQELLPDGVDTAGQHLWTAYDGEVPVGILWVFAEGDRGFIYDIEVREEQRRRGYGRELLDAAARAAIDLGARTLGLNVFGFNDAALAMYEKAGYVTTERSYRIAF
jgi:ribosomal protein S18 acetylase RimI-like enzyme